MYIHVCVFLCTFKCLCARIFCVCFLRFFGSHAVHSGLISPLVDPGDFAVTAQEGLQDFPLLQKLTGTVEIMRNKRLHKVYFRKPACSFDLTAERKTHFMDHANRETSLAKIESLVLAVPNLMRDMYHQEQVNRNRFHRFWHTWTGVSTRMSFFLVLLINALVLQNMIVFSRDEESL